MKWLFNENGYIYEQAPDSATGSNIYDSGSTDLRPLRLTWSYNDHSFWRWKWIDPTLTENLNIKLYSIITEEDSVDLITSYFTKSDFESLPSGVENVTITTTQANNLFASCGAPNYKIVSNEVLTRTDNEKLPCAKIVKDEKLKSAYMADILWTDDAKMFYDKFKIEHPGDTSKDAWFADVMTYWHEGRTERDANKTALENATTIAQVEAITYNPTHVKSKEEI
jgi:hypothetical protein